jgi:hypothetical protein
MADLEWVREQHSPESFARMSRLPFLPSIRRLSAASSLANRGLTSQSKAKNRFSGETAGARSAGLKFNGLIRLKVFESGPALAVVGSLL